MKNNNSNVAIILAGGIGSRFGGKINKSLIKINGKPSIAHVLEKYEKHKLINEIIVVLNENIKDESLKLIKSLKFKKIKKIVLGGKTRQDSTKIGIEACNKNTKKVLIQESVRILTSDEAITKTINKLDEFEATVMVFSPSDAIMKFNNKRIIKEIPNKKYLGRGQSPEGFRFEIIKKAHKLAEQENFDDVSENCGLIIKYNLGKIFAMKSNINNVKITHPEDLIILNGILKNDSKN